MDDASNKGETNIPEDSQARNWEPVVDQDAAPQASSEDIPARIRALVGGQRFCVLSTQVDGRPYGSLLAYSNSEDLRTIVFATPITTRKYALLKACAEVAAVIDNRAQTDDMMAIEAVTIMGQAQELTKDSDGWKQASRLYLARHPHLMHFIEAPSCALFSLTAARYLHVYRFQDVHEWKP